MFNMGKASLMILLFIGTAFISQKACAHSPKPGGNEAPFNYANTNAWGSISPQYALCSNGKKQSPIAIDSKTVKAAGNGVTLTPNYDVAEATLINTGVAVQLSVRGKSEFTLGKTYRLLNLRWHVPSEHVIDGVKYDAEMQQLFVSTDGQESIAIVSNLYKNVSTKGLDNVLNGIAANLMQMKAAGAKQEVKLPMKLGPLFDNVKSQFPTNRYFRYTGSLTTPPCVEEVTWIVNPKIQDISAGQLKMIHDVMGGDKATNSRPTQPLNGRDVLDVGK